LNCMPVIMAYDCRLLQHDLASKPSLSQLSINTLLCHTKSPCHATLSHHVLRCCWPCIVVISAQQLSEIISSQKTESQLMKVSRSVAVLGQQKAAGAPPTSASHCWLGLSLAPSYDVTLAIAVELVRGHLPKKAPTTSKPGHGCTCTCAGLTCEKAVP
jgi:hypothetical protein